jgi:DNA-binding CsgD family transcriptional regulator
MSANLSPRQKEAVELLADGHSWDTAAEEMGIERSTRNKHLYRVSVQTGQCIETILYLADNG